MRLSQNIVICYLFITIYPFTSGGGKGEPFEGDSSQIALEDVPGRVAGVQRVAA